MSACSRRYEGTRHLRSAESRTLHSYPPSAHLHAGHHAPAGDPLMQLLRDGMLVDHSQRWCRCNIAAYDPISHDHPAKEPDMQSSGQLSRSICTMERCKTFTAARCTCQQYIRSAQGAAKQTTWPASALYSDTSSAATHDLEVHADQNCELAGAVMTSSAIFT